MLVYIKNVETLCATFDRFTNNVQIFCYKKNIISFEFEMVFLFMNATKEAKRKEKGLKKSLHFIDIQ